MEGMSPPPLCSQNPRGSFYSYSSHTKTFLTTPGFHSPSPLKCASEAYAFKKLADPREKHQWHHMAHNLWKMLRNFASCHMKIILGECFYQKMLDVTFFIRLIFGRAGFFLAIIKKMDHLKLIERLLILWLYENIQKSLFIIVSSWTCFGCSDRWLATYICT